MKKPIVTLALDDKMLYAFFVLAHSLITTARRPFRMVIGHFHGRLSKSHQRTIRQFLDFFDQEFELWELTAHELFTERRHLTITTFSKFVLSDLIPQAHLWLDLDTAARAGWDDFFAQLDEASPEIQLVAAEKLSGPNTRFEGFNAGILGWTSATRADWLPELANLPEKRFSSEQHLFNTLYQSSVSKVDVSFNFLSSWHQETEGLQSARIVHFSGPVKPWHLLRRHRAAWRSINASWEIWFAAEEAMLADPRTKGLHSTLLDLSQQALFSGRLHTGKGALASLVLRLLALIGPIGDPIVRLIQRRGAS